LTTLKGKKKVERTDRRAEGQTVGSMYGWAASKKEKAKERTKCLLLSSSVE
jgi:hypothetical protein